MEDQTKGDITNMDDMEKSLRDTYACGVDGLRWACELYYEYYNSSVGMEHRIRPKDGILLNEDGTDSGLRISGAEKTWQCQHYDEAMSIYEAMKSFGVELWFTALLRTWLENGETKESLLKKLSRQYYYENIERVIKRV